MYSKTYNYNGFHQTVKAGFLIRVRTVYLDSGQLYASSSVEAGLTSQVVGRLTQTYFAVNVNIASP